MFTGIVQAVGSVVELLPTDFGVRLVVDPGCWGHKPGLGESIAVSGCCLTVVEGPQDRSSDPLLRFDVVSQTLALTRLDGFKPGTRVNLEHAARADTLLGGHLVQGHIDLVGRVESVQTGADHRVRIEPGTELMPFVTPQGSIAVDGVSLTIAEVDPAAGWFEVALIPTTLDMTTLGELAAGDAVNLEADSMAKTVVNFLAHYQGRSNS